MASPTQAAPSANSWTRRDRPCDACRKRKIRCLSSENPSRCVLCESHSKDCTFVASPPRRKRRLDSHDDQDVPNVRQRPEPVQATRPKLPQSNYSNIQGPSLLINTLGHQNRQCSLYLGLTTDYDGSLLNLAPFDSNDEYASKAGILRRPNYGTHFLMIPDNQVEKDEEISTLDAIEDVVSPHGPALVDLYFRIVHPSFPIIHKKVFLEKHGRTYRELTPAGLAAVYILALNWWSYSMDLSELPKPDVKKLERMIPKMMSEAYNRPKISDLQAGLVLLQRPEGDSWALTGQLIALAQNLGIHLDCSDWRIPDWERGVRKRAAWALFMQDKWGSLVHGRPSLILPDNWAVKPLENGDFPETAKDDDDEEGSSEVEKGKSIFVHLVSLTEILSDILATFCTLKAASSGEATTEVLEKAKPLQIRLKSWHSSLPADLSMDESKARKLSSTGYLHLAYFTAEITLHRAILRSDNLSLSPNHVTPIIRMAARTRFTSAMAFIQRLRPEHLQSFWYFASKINLSIIGTFGAMLWATSDNGAEGEFYKSKLAEYRWLLRVSSTAAPFMKWAIGRLDATMVLLTDLGVKTAGGKTEFDRGAAADKVELHNWQDQSPSSEQLGLSAGGHPDFSYTGSRSISESTNTPAFLWDNVESASNAEFLVETGPVLENWFYGFDNVPAPGHPGLLDNTIPTSTEFDTSGDGLMDFWRFSA